MSDGGKDVAVREDNIVASIVLKGDISGLSQTDKVVYYNRFCESLGLNPLTRPFQYLRLNGKEVLYATKDATEQLRKLNSVSVLDIETNVINDVYIAKAKGRDATGRTDTATGAVNIKGLTGDTLANAIMKAETKAKRRLTLSICGLGILDETELETIPASAIQTVAEVKEFQQLPDLSAGRAEIEKLIEAYEPMGLAAEVIVSARLDMEAAKSINDMRAVYRELKSICTHCEREQSRIESRESAKVAGGKLMAEVRRKAEKSLGNEPELPDGDPVDMFGDDEALAGAEEAFDKPLVKDPGLF